jgi:hypothetical protein
METRKQVRFAFAIGLCLIACNKDDEPTPRDLILGKWTVSNLDTEVKVGNSSLLDYLKSEGMTASEAVLYANQVTGSLEYLESTTIEFKDNGTYTSANVPSSNPGQWELSADGKQLTTDKSKAAEVVFTIVSLTKSKMELTSSLDSEDYGPDPFTFHMSMTLTK